MNIVYPELVCVWDVIHFIITKQLEEGIAPVMVSVNKSQSQIASLVEISLPVHIAHYLNEPSAQFNIFINDSNENGPPVA